MLASSRLALVAAALTFSVTSGFAPRAHAGSGTALLKFVPEDASLVVSMDVAGARGTDLFAKAVAKLDALNDPRLATVKAAGFDPTKDVDTFVVAGKTKGQDLGGFQLQVAILEGRFSPALQDAIAKDKTVTVKTYKRVTYWVGDKASGAIIDQRLFVTQGKMEPIIDLVKGRGKNAAKSPKAAALRAAIATTDTRNHFWFAALLPATMRTQATAAGFDVLSISMAASITKSLSVEVKVVTASEAAAAAVVTKATAGLAEIVKTMSQLGLGAAAKSLTIDHDLATVRGAVLFSEAELKTAWTMLAGFL